MVIIITGASHTGKTCLSQMLLQKYSYPYLSLDHLKMGLIRSSYTALTVADDEKLTQLLWPIVKEMIKTVIENNQNLIIEGLYVPFNWEKDFEKEYKQNIKYCCLVMTEKYIKNHYDEIITHANDIEKRLEDELSKEALIRENLKYLNSCEKEGLPYVLIDETYPDNITV